MFEWLAIAVAYEKAIPLNIEDLKEIGMLIA